MRGRWGPLALVVLLSACDTCEEKRSDRRPIFITAPSAIASAIGVEAGAVAVEQTDPAAPSGDLKAEIARFKGLDACAKEHAGTDPLVGESLAVIGYDTVIRDSCRVLDALTAKDAAKCEPIGSGALRAHCQSTVAIVFANPAGCAWEVPADPSRGRSAMCLSIAARDPRMCALETPSARARCEAMAKGDPKACGAAGDGQARCARDVARYRGLVTQTSDKLPPLAKASATLAVLTDQTRKDDVSADVQRGVVVYQKGFRWLVEIGRFQHEGSSNMVMSPGRPARIAVRLGLGSGGLAEVERVELDVPRKGTLAYPGLPGAFKATYQIDRKRGGSVTVSLDGKLGDIAVKLDAVVLIRDVVEDPSVASGPRDR